MNNPDCWFYYKGKDRRYQIVNNGNEVYLTMQTYSSRDGSCSDGMRSQLNVIKCGEDQLDNEYFYTNCKVQYIQFKEKDTYDWFATISTIIFLLGFLSSNWNQKGSSKKNQIILKRDLKPFTYLFFLGVFLQTNWNVDDNLLIIALFCNL